MASGAAGSGVGVKHDQEGFSSRAFTAAAREQNTTATAQTGSPKTRMMDDGGMTEFKSGWDSAGGETLDLAPDP